MAREPHTKSQLIHPPVSEEPIRENPCQNTPHLRPFRRLRAERRGRLRRPSLRPDFHRSPIPSPLGLGTSGGGGRGLQLDIACDLAVSDYCAPLFRPTPTRAKNSTKTKEETLPKACLVTLPNTRGANAWFRYQKIIYLVCPF